jgi:predicted ATPase with chaperone activity
MLVAPNTTLESPTDNGANSFLCNRAAAPPPAAPRTPLPRVPNTLAEAGLSMSLIEALVLKMLYVRGDMIGRELAKAMGLKFSLVEPVMESLKQRYFVQVKASLGIGLISAMFAVSEEGRAAARDHMKRNQYTGPAPVPLGLYCDMVRLQGRKAGWLAPERLAQAYRHMVLRPEVLRRLGPAVNSGSSFLIYGQPGNGKTYLAEALADLDDEQVYVPHAIECNGAIIQVFDPVYHRLAEEDAGESVVFKDDDFDRRFIKCKRPFIASGGELAMSMLDLTYNESAGVYDAPLQMKANNGIYLIDDFGRQVATPAQILNRWIVPLERQVDYLNLAAGGKITVPFAAFLVFSTNLRPEQLGDEAFLRRIRYKMLVKSPDPAEFLQIFDVHCKKAKISADSGVLDSFVRERYTKSGKAMRRCQPRDLVAHATDLMNFEGLPPILTREVLDTAFGSCFAEETE